MPIKISQTSLLTDHSTLLNLGHDDHTQYALLLGRATGQILIGGTASGDDLLFQSTSHATKGSVALGSLTTGLVYDETNNRLSLGTNDNTLTINGTSYGCKLHIDAAGGTDLAEVCFGRHSDTAGLGSHLVLSRSRGTHASPTIVQANDYLARINGCGYDGTDFEIAAQIDIQVDGTPGSNDMPGRIVFNTTADGATSPTERLRISANGTIKESAGKIVKRNAQSDNYTVLITDFYVVFTGTGPKTFTLPTTPAAGTMLIIKHKGTGILTVDGAGSETIYGNPTVALTYDQSVTLIFDGTSNWELN